MSCPVCAHPQRHLIEQALFLAVQSPQRVAVNYALALGALLDHQQAHVLWPRPPVERCLPGLHEPGGVNPPGHTPRCRHCDSPLPGNVAPPPAGEGA